MPSPFLLEILKLLHWSWYLYWTTTEVASALSEHTQCAHLGWHLYHPPGWCLNIHITALSWTSKRLATGTSQKLVQSTAQDKAGMENTEVHTSSSSQQSPTRPDSA